MVVVDIVRIGDIIRSRCSERRSCEAALSEDVLIVGAGITGLGSALALAAKGQRVTLLERDPPPPETSPDDAFEVWERKGVGHLRHSHAFLAVLYRLIKHEYPDLLRALVGAGCRELGFAEGLSDTVKETYIAEPGDDDLTILTSRRTTLEYVIRKYVTALPEVTIESDVTVRDLICETHGDGSLDVKGVMAERGGETREWRADVTLDAGGRNSQLVPWLMKHGARVDESLDPSGILYYTRHYRLKPGQEEPKPGKTPAAGDLGYIKFGVFPADNGCFSITFALPEIEMEMRKAIVQPEQFDALCANLPGIATWTDPARAEPKGRVLGMGDIKATWREFVPGGKAVAHNFFALGDAAIRTNPLYGRGCSFGFIQAHVLADVLDQTSDLEARAVRFHAGVRTQIRPYFDDMVRTDKQSIKAAHNALDPDYKPGFRARLMKRFVEDGITIVIRTRADILRMAMKSFHMVEKPNLWMRKPSVIFTIARVWARGKKRNAAYYPPKLGPDRREMFESLGLSWQKDIDSLAKGEGT